MPHKVAAVNITTCVLIRFHYQKRNNSLQWRYKHFVNNVLPKLQNQTYKHFDIWIRCYDWHKEMFESLGLKTFFITTETEKCRVKGKKRFLQDFATWDKVVGLPKYDIQVRLDSDDYVHPQFIHKVITAVNKHRARYVDKTLFLSFQPELLRLKSNKISDMLDYKARRTGSAFAALYQPERTINYRFIYDTSHIHFGKTVDRQLWLPKGYCFALAHSQNQSTGKLK